MHAFFRSRRLLLAPMAGVSDEAFRTLCREQGADLTYTEMVSAKGLSYANEKTRHLLRLAPGEGQVAVQLFGHEPDTMAAQAAWIEREMGPVSYTHLDVYKRQGGNADSLCLVADADIDGDGASEWRALFTGDAERDQLRALIDEGLVDSVDLYKVGHHGSKNALDDEEAAVLSPVSYTHLDVYKRQVLLNETDNDRFLLCALASKRAHDINDMMRGQRDRAIQLQTAVEIARAADKKPLSLAFNEIARGEVSYDPNSIDVNYH